ncbi:hypothetical protein OIV83_000042 [Microbotryomycetes sp. JL201]|nr:hypothetical protein OIV83_000042 [Microbotryomycetes sp. JL201]
MANFDKDSLVIRRLASRAELLEAKLTLEAGTRVDSPTTVPSIPATPHEEIQMLSPRSRTVSDSSGRWWRPRASKSRSSEISWRRSWSVQADGWSALQDSKPSSIPMSRVESKQMRNQTKVLEARRKTQDWLAATSVSRGGRSTWKQWKARSKELSKRSWLLFALVIIALALAITMSTALASRFRTSSDQILSKDGTYFARSVSNDTKFCDFQLSLLTLPNIDVVNFPLRLAWTESAILWANVYAESLTGIRRFASALEFDPFGDSPSAVSVPRYQLLVSGYVFDFSALTREPPDVSWSLRAKPTPEQETLVSASAKDVLNRVATFAVAGSNGRQKALEHFWYEHGFQPDQLDTFKKAVAQAPLVVPFKLGHERDTPLGCRSSLSEHERSALNELEHGIFGLPAVSRNGSRDCSSRPTYAILDILGLSKLDRFASDFVVVDSHVKSRCTFVNVPLGDSSELRPPSPTSLYANDGSLSVTLMDFGIPGYLDHVLLMLLKNLVTSKSHEQLNEFVNQVVTRGRGGPSWRGPFVSLQAQIWGPA